MNDDLIRRQAAIDETWKEPSYTDPYNVLTEVREMIQSLPSAQQWILCSERLPEEEGVYFVTFNKSCLLENELPVMDAIWRDGQWQYSVLESY